MSIHSHPIPTPAILRGDGWDDRDPAAPARWLCCKCDEPRVNEVDTCPSCEEVTSSYAWPVQFTEREACGFYRDAEPVFYGAIHMGEGL